MGREGLCGLGAQTLIWRSFISASFSLILPVKPELLPQRGRAQEGG